MGFSASEMGLDVPLIKEHSVQDPPTADPHSRVSAQTPFRREASPDIPSPFLFSIFLFHSPSEAVLSFLIDCVLSL